MTDLQRRVEEIGDFNFPCGSRATATTGEPLANGKVRMVMEFFPCEVDGCTCGATFDRGMRASFPGVQVVYVSKEGRFQ